MRPQQNRFRRFLGHALARVQDWFGPTRPSSVPRERCRLAPLLQLEDRRLLSATPVGTEFRVNTYTNGTQITSPPPNQQSVAQTVAVNPKTGNSVVTWSSQNQDGSGWGVYAQRFNAAGIPQGGEFQVNTTTANDQEYSSVAMDASGNFVITWSGHQSGHWNVYAQMYSATGVPQGGEFQVNTSTGDDREYSSVAMGAAGNFVITWSSHNQDGSGWGVYAQRYNAAGVAQGGEFQVNTTTANDQEYSTVAMDASGNFVITWSGHQSGHWNVYAQRYNAAGVPQGGEFQVNTSTGDDREYSSVAMDPGSGNFVITWSSHNQDGDGWGVYAQRYNAAGVAQGGEFQVNTTTAHDQEFSAVAVDAGSGNFIITWSGNQNGHWNVYAQKYSAAGVPQGGEFQVNTSTGEDRAYSSAALDGNGNLLIDWSSKNQDGSEWGVYAQRYAVPDLIVTPTSGLQTTEAGGTATFNVVLTTQPTANVLVPVVSSDITQGTVSQPLLTFTPANWNVPQTVTVTGVDNLLPDGNTPYTVTVGSAVGTDANFSGLRAVNVGVTNLETAAPGILVSPAAGLVTTDTGGTASFTVVLASKPGNPVTIPVSSSNTSAGIVSTSSLFFPPGQWNVPQTVTVTGVDDHIVTPDMSYQVVFGAAQSGDPAYSGLTASPVSLTNLETDRAGVKVTGSSFLVVQDNSVVRVDARTGAVLATYPTGLANDGATFGPDGSLYVADYYNNQILHYGPSGAFVASFGAGYLSNPQGLTFGLDGNLYVTNVDSSVQEFSPTGVFLRTFIPAGSGGLWNAKAIVWGPDGNAYVSSFYNSTVFRYDGNTGAFLGTFASAGSGGFEDLTFGPDGNLYVASYWDNTVYRFRGSDGALLGAFVSGGNLVNPFGLRFDSAGNLEVTSRPLGQIQTYDSTGAFLGELATGLTNPAYLTDTTSLVTSETGTSATFSVALISQPAADVTVSFSSTAPGQGSLSRSVLTFTSANWNAAQTVTVTGLDDHIVNGDQTYQITGTTASADASYNGLALAPVTVTNTEADTAGFVVTPATGLVTSDGVGWATFNVSLASQPTAPVDISVASSNTNRGTVSTSQLTFDASNWNVAQTVTVTGSDSNVNDVGPYSILLGPAASADPVYNGLVPSSVSVANTEADAFGVFVTPTTGLVTTEAGGTATFQVYLSDMPTANVTIPVSSSNPGAGVASTSSLTFTPANWNAAQTVTVTGVDDHIVTGNVAYQVILGTAQSADARFAGVVPPPVSLTNQETDVASLSVSSASLQTTEAGGTATFNVSLTSIPGAQVTLTLNSSAPSQGRLSASTLTFDASNWNVPQTVTVTGLDDHIADANQTYQITGTVASGDTSYNGQTLGPINVLNQEVGQPGFIVTRTSGLVTTEAGGTDSFAIALAEQPTADVTIPVTSSNPAAGTVSTASLTFTPTNWSQAQTVTVTGVDDHRVTGDTPYQVMLGATQSGDTSYAGLLPPAVSVTNREMDQAGFVVSPTSGLSTTTDGTATFTVALTSIPAANVQITLSSSDPQGGTVLVPSLTFMPAGWNVPQTVVIRGGTGTTAYSIVAAPAVSTDPVYNGLRAADVALTNLAVAPTPVAPSPIGSIAPPITSPATAPTPPAAAPPAEPRIVPASLSSVVPSAAPGSYGVVTAAGAAGTPALSGGTGASVASATFDLSAESSLHALGSTTATDLSRVRDLSSTPASAVGTTLAPQALQVRLVALNADSSRAVDSVSGPIFDGEPSLAGRWLENPAMLDLLPPHTLPRSPRLPRSGAPATHLVLREAFEDLDEQVPASQGTARGASEVAVAGLLATAGYVLLNTRTGVWMLSLLTSRPLWRDLDPLEVLYAWEKELDNESPDAHKDENLLALVE
jgi:hypothetical protein